MIKELEHDSIRMASVAESNIYMDHGAIHQMILDDLKQVKIAVDNHAKEMRTDIGKVRDQMSGMERQFSRDMTEHAVDITELQTKARGIALVAGSLSGFAVSVVVAIITVGLRYLIS